jgi:lysophospholipase L1-like esterase
MAGWHATIKQDLAPLPVIARGFGGSNMNDALFFVDRVVNRYRPRAVVLYEGDNDIAAGIAPERIRDTFLAFTKAIHRQLPETRIYVISIKPSPSRWALWPRTVEANRLLQAACTADAKRLTYVSVVEGMLGPDGKPQDAIYKADRLHMNAKGYAIWRDVLRPILMKRESPIATDVKPAAVAP